MHSLFLLDHSYLIKCYEHIHIFSQNIFIQIYKSLLKKCLVYVQNKILNAMKIQLNATYGLFRSPIRAHFQNKPRNPTFPKRLSKKLGAIDLI